MAKKSGFNMSEEIRQLLRADRKMTGTQVYNALKKKFPRKAINRGSMGVAFTNARQKLGISAPKKKAEKAKKRGGKVVRRVARPSTDNISLSALRSARELLAATSGDVSTATAILKEMKALQD